MKAHINITIRADIPIQVNILFLCVDLPFTINRAIFLAHIEVVIVMKKC